MEVKEIGPVADGVIRQRDIFNYQTRNGLPGWRVVNKSSAHREQLEALGVVLSDYPAVLEPDFTALYKEAAYRKEYN